MSFKYDLGIVGSGPAGYTAALHARKKGLSVVLFEKEQLGGVCLNKGCIPTKAILQSADVYEKIRNACSFGINMNDAEIDIQAVIERKNQIVSKLRKGLELSLKNSGVVVVYQKADVIDKNTIKAGDETYLCSKIIIASGSLPRELPNNNCDHLDILNSDDVLNMQTLPKSIAIIGSGAIGIEWARIFSNFGVEVSVIEAADNLLPLADIEVSKRIERIFKAQKINYYKGVSVRNIETNNLCRVNLADGNSIESEKVLVAIGRYVPNFEKIEGVSYLGDINKEIQLAHFASKQAINLIDGINFDKSLVPSVVYGNPEIAWIGKREQDLEPNSYKKSMMLISALGKAQCDGSTDGFIKILSSNNKIIGAHIVSNEASALIQEILIAMQNDISVDKLKEVCFAHPTYSEGIFESLFNL